MTALRSSAEAAWILARQSVPPPPVSCGFDAGGENALDERIVLHAAERLPPFRPIDADRGDLGGVGGEEGFHQRGDFGRRQRAGSLTGEEFRDAFIASDIAFAAEHAPVDRERRLAERAAMVGERIEEGIGRRVVPLRRISEDAGDRGEHHEAVEVHALRVFVQQPCAMRFRRHHRAQPLGGQRGKRRVVDDHREVENALERSSGADFGDEALHVLRRADVRFQDFRFDAAGFEAGDEIHGFRSGSAAAAAQHEVAGTASRPAIPRAPGRIRRGRR